MPKSGRCALAYLFAGLYVQSVAVIVNSVVRSGSRAALNAEYLCLFVPGGQRLAGTERPVLLCWLTPTRPGPALSRPGALTCQSWMTGRSSPGCVKQCAANICDVDHPDETGLFDHRQVPETAGYHGVTKECVSRPTVSGLCGDVAQVRVGEERPDQSRAFLEPPQCADGFGFEVLLAGDPGLADPVVLHVFPDPFVWVELG
jgi:hypothetical protein